MSAARAAACAAAACLLIAGCGANNDELQQWMEQQRKEVKPNVPPLIAPKRFNPQPYTALGSVDPFSTQKLSVGLQQQTREPNSALAAEMRRRPEALEAFPLDNMTMVGTVSRQGQVQALLKVGPLLHQVKVGDHLGQNFGKIIRITETEVELRELVQDAVGESVERRASLQLQEKAR